MLKAGSNTLCALRQFGSCVSEVNKPRPVGPPARDFNPPATFLAKRDSSHSWSTSSKPDTTKRDPPGTASSKMGAVFARQLRQAFDRMSGVDVEQVSHQQVPWRARYWLQVNLGTHVLSPLQALRDAFLGFSSAPEVGMEIQVEIKFKLMASGISESYEFCSAP